MPSQPLRLYQGEHKNEVSLTVKHYQQWTKLSFVWFQQKSTKSPDHKNEVSSTVKRYEQLIKLILKA